MFEKEIYSKILLLVFCLCVNASGQFFNWQAIDTYALKTPKEEEKSLENLSQYLSNGLKNDQEKARSIFRWITNNIAYDVDSFFSGSKSDYSAEGVLRNRKAVCEGYSSLFERLGLLSGLAVVKIRGYGKGYGYIQGAKFNDTNHTWNAVKIEEKWYLIDTTWGAGYVNGKEFIKSFEEFYFLTPPEQFIFDHFPCDPNWQLLDKPISLTEFEDQIYLRPHFFKLGFSMNEIQSRINDDEFRGFPTVYGFSDEKVVLHNAPLDRFLQSGDELSFNVEAPNALSVAVINAGNWQYLKEENGVFSGTINSKTGKLSVNVQFRGKGESYWTLLEYVVE